MANIPVNNNLSAFNRMVNTTASAQGSQNAPYANASYTKQEEALKDSFDMVMNRVNSQAKPAADVQSGSQMTARTQTAAKTQTVAKAQTTAGSRTLSSGAAAVNNHTSQDTKVSETGSKMADKAGNDKVSGTVSNDETARDAVEGTGAVENQVENGMADAQDAVTEAGEKLVEDIAEEMGVTPEEVVEAMEILGLSAIQLLDPENMKQLLMVISGNEDQLSIITDGELYGHLQNLLNTVSVSLNELEADLGLSEEELKALIAEMAATEDMSGAAENAEELAANAGEPETATLEGMKDYAVTVHRDGDEVKVKVQVDDTGANQSVREEVTQTSEVQTRQETKSDNRESFADNRGEGSMQDAFMAQIPVEQPSVSEAAETQAMGRFTSTEEIMNQITEYIKINLKSDVQEMELQLHPASLGSVNVQLAARDGVITAQFTAQNETVKEAIESQLVQLKTQFEEQGIKVDAVEVTVANYRFEQNFSGKEENSGESSKNGKKGPRRINLNDMNLEELPEDMEDSERIAAEMMARSGNTVDYTA
ncbi:MAG: flagellar hook-length control protein FliK [Lachnospiraceae bacterium]|nr:flagellar hook-length control protein FliK [Lachnospiraceae bacterium]